MTLVTKYYPGGYDPQSSAHNLSDQWDSAAGTYTAWDTSGNVTASRALNTVELADLALRDTATATIANRGTIQQQAQTALTNNRTYLAVVSPTNAQVAAQVRALTQQNQVLIRCALADFTGTS